MANNLLVQVGPWQWVDGMWMPPEGVVACVDLRSLPQCATAEQQQGYGLFVSPDRLGDDYRIFASDLDGRVTPHDRSVMASQLGVSALQSTSAVDLLWELLTVASDPDGEQFAKPIIPNASGMCELHLGGYVRRERNKGVDTPHWRQIQRVMQNDYACIRRACGHKEMHRKALECMRRKLGLSPEQATALLIPSGLPRETPLQPSTSVSDDFNRADGALGANWTNTSGTHTISTNRALANNDFAISAYTGTALSTDDHYADAVVNAVNDGAGSVRNSDSAATCYGLRWRTDRVSLNKIVAGTITGLVSDLETMTYPRNSRISVNGSVISVSTDATSHIVQTDTSITGNLFAGIHNYSTGKFVDGFAAADIPVALSSAAIAADGDSIVLTFTDAVTIGAGGNGGVTIEASGGNPAASYVSGDGTANLTYSLSRTVYATEVATLSYVQPGDGIVGDVTSDEVASFAGAAVTNNSTETAIPTVVGVTVAADGDSIVFEFSLAMHIGAAGHAGLLVRMTGGGCVLTYASGDGTDTLTYTTSRTIRQGEEGTHVYTQPGNGLESIYLGDLASYYYGLITNNSTVTATIDPVVVITDLAGTTSGNINVMGPGVVHVECFTKSDLGDGDWGNAKVEWNFGDSTSHKNTMRGFSASHLYEHEPAENRSFTITCTITNIAGDSASATRTVVVAPNTRTVQTVLSAATLANNTEYRLSTSGTHVRTGAFAGGAYSNILIRSATANTKATIDCQTVTDLFNCGNNWLFMDLDVVTTAATRCDNAFVLTGSTNYNLGVARVDCDPAAITMATHMNGGRGMLLQELDIETTQDKNGVWIEGEMATLLDVTSVHSGTERPLRGPVVGLCMDGVITTTTAKSGVGTEKWFFAYCKDCEIGYVFPISHNSSSDTDAEWIIVERSKVATTVADGSAVLWPNNGTSRHSILRNCIIDGGHFVFTPDSPLHDVRILNNTIVDDATNQGLLLAIGTTAGFITGLKFDNNIYINPNVVLSASDPKGMVAFASVDDGSSEFVSLVGNITPVPASEPAPTKDTYIGATYRDWATANAALAYASGNMRKALTLDEDYRVVSPDADLVGTMPDDMAQFQEDYFGNPRTGDWLKGAVGAIAAPTVTTAAASEIRATSAVLGGNVTSDGGAAVTNRGVCWGTSENPTYLGNNLNVGSGTGEFVGTATGLLPNTLYYSRAWADNSEGLEYGANETFTTLAGVDMRARSRSRTRIR